MNEIANKPLIRLLLVEDDQVDRLTCKRALEKHSDFDFEVHEAETGEQGLRIARAEQFDCILLDQNLPDFNGVEFLAELARGKGEQSIPVVMLTGTDNAMLAVETLKLGAYDYVVKGMEREPLQWLPSVVLRTLREHQSIQEKATAAAQLREAEAKYRSLVEQIPAITYIASLECPGKLLYISPQVQQLGYPSETWLAESEGLHQFLHADDRDIVTEAYAQTYAHHTPLHCEYRLVKHDGQACWFLDEAHVVVDEDGKPLFLQGVLVDVTKDKDIELELFYYRRRLEELVAQRTEQLEKQNAILNAANANLDQSLVERKQAETALRISEAHFRLLLESVGEGILGLDAKGCCIFVNQAALTMLGYAHEELIGQDTHATIHQSCADGLPIPSEQWLIYNAFRKGIAQRGTEIFRRKDGSPFSVEYSAYPMQLGQQITGAVLVFRDVTESLCYQATHDPLTGFINRTEFERRTARLMSSSHENQSEHVLCYLDLDKFKLINDTCGHAVGDEFLRKLAALLHSKLRQRDTIARLGGDEFALLLEHCPLEQAWSIVNELCESVRDFRFNWEGKAFSVSVSIGITTLASTAGDVATALSAADAACYIAKEKGRDQIHLFQSYDKGNPEQVASIHGSTSSPRTESKPYRSS